MALTLKLNMLPVKIDCAVAEMASTDFKLETHNWRYETIEGPAQSRALMHQLDNRGRHMTH